MRRGADGFYHPSSEEQLIELVNLARTSKPRKQLRVCGSSHSVSGAIFTDGGERADRIHVHEAPDTDRAINVRLDGYRGWKVIDHRNKLVQADAGIHLGADPSDPEGTATLEASLLWNLAQLGWALDSTGGVTHQTVSGFTATGSAGASIKHSVNQNLYEFRIIDGLGQTHDFRRGRDPEFDAMAPNLGLLGVVSKITFKCTENFAVRGREVVVPQNKRSLDLFGPGLKRFLRTTDYARIEWWPQKGVERAVVWQAERLAPGTAYTYKRFDRFDSSTDWAQHKLALVYSLLCNLDNITHAKFTLHDNFAYVRRGWVDAATRRRLGPIGRLLAGALGRLAEFGVDVGYDLCRLIRWPLKWLRPKLFPRVADRFIPLSEDGAKTFADQAYAALPMDNDVNDVLLPTTFTEAWIPIGRTQDVMKALRTHFYDGLSVKKSYERTGTYGWELYAAQASPFWLSPSYSDGNDEWAEGVVRVDPYWYADSGKEPDALFEEFWKLLRDEGIHFRLHWAKHLPKPDADWVDYWEQRYPCWQAFMKLRARLDPDGIFLTRYWREHLGIDAPLVPVPEAPVRVTGGVPIAVGLAACVLVGLWMVWADVPNVVKAGLGVAVLAVVAARLVTDNVVTRNVVRVGLFLFPILALAGIAAVLAARGVVRVDPEVSVLIGGAIVFLGALIYRRPWWSRTPRFQPWYTAFWCAVALVVLPPLAAYAYDKFTDRGRPLELGIDAVSKLEVILLQEGEEPRREYVPEMRGWEVTTWVGRVTGEAIEWGAGGAPPKARSNDTDRVLILAVDGALPERLNAPLEPAQLPADQISRWVRVAGMATEEGTPTFPLLQTTNDDRVTRWTAAIQKAGLRGEARRLDEFQGNRSPMELAMILAVDAPGADQYLALAAKHRPHLFFDSRETYHTPLNIDQVLKSGKVRLCGGAQAVERLCPEIDSSADLRNPGMHLAFKPAELARETKDSTVYVNVEKATDGMVYLDYWWYLPDNPSGAVGGAFCGVGFVIAGRTCLDHVSDWEGVTVILGRDKKPAAVAYAQHNRVMRYTWPALQEIWRRDTKWEFRGKYDTRERPLVFIARGSHASYPKRCPHSRCEVPWLPWGKQSDSAADEQRHDGGRPWPVDEQRDCPTVCVLAFPTRNHGKDPARWNAFDGLWGTSKCVLGRACSDSDPPRSPSRQRRFTAPGSCTRAATWESGRFRADPEVACRGR